MMIEKGRQWENSIVAFALIKGSP